MDKNEIKELIMAERSAAVSAATHAIKDDKSPLIIAFIAGLLGSLLGSGFMMRKQKRKQKKQDRLLCMSVAQYDKEVAMYQDIWEKLCDCTASVKSLVSFFSFESDDEQDAKTCDIVNYNKARKDYTQFASCIERYSPFCKGEDYAKLVKIRNRCMKIINLSYIDTPESQFSNEKKEAFDAIDQLQNELRDDIRHYIENLQVVQAQ